MWTERQQAMLREIGVRVWSAPLPAALPPSTGASATVAERESSPVPSVAAVAARLPPALPALPAPASVRSAPASPAMRGDVAALDWQALRTAVSACREIGRAHV